MPSSSKNSKELWSVVSSIFEPREKNGTNLVDDFLQSLKECSDNDLSVIREWKTFKALCEASVNASQHVLKKTGFEKTVLSWSDPFSFALFYRHPLEALQKQIRYASSTNIIYFLSNDVPEPFYALHTKKGQSIRLFVIEQNSTISQTRCYLAQ